MTVSLIVPVYNAEKYLEEFLNSVACQTFEDFEAVLVDDGSTDASGVILDEFAAKDERLKVVHKPNGGVVGAWKCGVERSCGDYIAFADPDDVLMPNMLETQYKLIEQYNADVVVTGCKCLKSDSERPMKVFEKSLEGLCDGEKLDRLKTRMFGTPSSPMPPFRFFKWNKLFKRTLITDNLDYSDDAVSYGDDVCVTAAAVYDSKRVYFSDVPLYIYRIHDGSITTSKYSDKEADNVDALIKAAAHTAEAKGYPNVNITAGYAALHTIRLVKKICRSDMARKDKKAALSALNTHAAVENIAVSVNGDKLPRGKRAVMWLLRQKMHTPLLAYYRKKK